MLSKHQKQKKSEQNTALERFPIRLLSEKTAVGSSTLRAWERRYGLLQPQRTPKGHRLYSEDDTIRVLSILDLLNDGHALPVIAEILAARSTTAGMQTEAQALSTNPASSQTTVWENLIQTTLLATADFNIERIDAIYNEASSLYPVDMVTDRLIQPTLKVLGNAWKEYPESGIAEEHFYTSWLKNRLSARFQHEYSHARGARIICACAPGSDHEVGLMLFALSALTHGYRVLYFGANLPLDQLPHITRRAAAKAVVLSVQTQFDQEKNAELSTLIKQLNVPVFAGGINAHFDTEGFQSSGGVLLGANIAVALRVFESHVPAYPIASNKKG